MEKVICHTPQEFSAECQKHPASIVRGRTLYSREGEAIAELVTTRGGSRNGAGRPETDRSISISVRISQEAYDKLKNIGNKSLYIDRLIKEADNE